MKIDITLIALLAGHFIGDFMLQHDYIATHKTKSTWWLITHVLIMSSVTWGLLGSINAWLYVLLIACTHLFIDYFKIKLQSRSESNELEQFENKRENKDMLIFVGDQIVHLVSLVLIWFIVGYCFNFTNNNYWLDLFGVQYIKALILLSGFALCVWGIGIFLQYQMEPLPKKCSEEEMKGLPKGGWTIGLLERTLIFIFVLMGKPEGVAFVIAAKSVFRIGDLTKEADRLYAEYIMIGTLRSFTYALVIAYFINWLLTHISWFM